MTTESLEFAVLEHHAETGRLRTRCRGELGTAVHKLRPAANGQLCAVHAQVVALRLHDGELRFLPITEAGEFGEPFSARVDEMNILDMAFLAGTPVPTLVFVHQDAQYRRVKTYTVETAGRRIERGRIKLDKADLHAHAVVAVPAPLGGAVVVGESSVVYIDGSVEQAVAKPPGLVGCHAVVDEDRILLGDHAGALSMVFFERAEREVTALRIERLGRVPWPSALLYIDAGVLFVGSVYGDSQLVRLSATPVPDSDGFVELLETYSNIGPTVDFCVVDLARQAQSQLVGCAGAGEDGSLRVVRNAVGIHEHAEIEMPGVQGIWSLKGPAAADDNRDVWPSDFQSTPHSLPWRARGCSRGSRCLVRARRRRCTAAPPHRGCGCRCPPPAARRSPAPAA